MKKFSLIVILVIICISIMLCLANCSSTDEKTEAEYVKLGDNETITIGSTTYTNNTSVVSSISFSNIYYYVYKSGSKIKASSQTAFDARGYSAALGNVILNKNVSYEYKANVDQNELSLKQVVSYEILDNVSDRLVMYINSDLLNSCKIYYCRYKGYNSYCIVLVNKSDDISITDLSTTKLDTEYVEVVNLATAKATTTIKYFKDENLSYTVNTIEVTE